MDLLKSNIAIKVNPPLASILRAILDSTMSTLVLTITVGKVWMCQLTRHSLFQHIHMQRYHAVPIELLVSNLNKT